MKLIAKSLATGLYFDGTAFEAISPESAMELRPGTTSESFRLSWAGKIDVVDAEKELKELRRVCPNYGKGKA
jgi:hypothetical protein